MNTEKLIAKGVKHHFNGKETVFEVDSLHKHFEGLLIHESDIFLVEQYEVEVGYIVASDVNFDNATENEVGMSFAKAEEILKVGGLIALPEWKGFWFNDIKADKTLVLTKEGEILDTPWEICKESNEWKVAVATNEQNQILKDYFAKVEDIEVVDAEVLTGQIEHVVTAETLNDNPELVHEGVLVGETITVDKFEREFEKEPIVSDTITVVVSKVLPEWQNEIVAEQLIKSIKPDGIAIDLDAIAETPAPKKRVTKTNTNKKG